MKLSFELDVPDGAIDPATEAELLRLARQQTVLRLYSDDRVTTSEAAEMLGLTRIQFLDLLRRSGIEFRAELDGDDFAGLRRRRDEHLSRQ
jgi:predicted HTH domain antitoxin